MEAQEKLSEQPSASVLEAVEQRLKDLRDEVARINVESAQHKRDLARLANELGKWLAAKAKEDAVMNKRVDDLQLCVKRLSQIAQSTLKS